MANKIEFQKLLHILQSENEEKKFSFLLKLSAEELKMLRIRTVEIIDLDQSDIWNRIARVSKFMPNFLNAKVAETILGPLLTANLSTHIPVKDAVAIMRNLSIPFLAEVSEFMIPEKSKDLIENIPIDLMKKITEEVIRNNQHFTASNFVNVLSLPKIIAVSDVIQNELDLILIAEFVDNKSYIAKIVEGFSDIRILRIIKTAYQNHKQDEIMTVFGFLSTKELNRILALIKQLPQNEQDIILRDFEGRINV